MSLSPNFKWNPTEEEKERKAGKISDGNDRSLIQIKTTLNGYISKVDDFLRKQMNNASTNNLLIGKASARLSEQRREISDAQNSGNLSARMNNEIFEGLLEDSIPVLKQAYIDKFDETIARLQKRLENNTNPDILASLGRDIDMMTDTKQVISNFDFENLSSYIYGIETFDILDNKRLLSEEKSRLEVVLIKLEENKDEIKSNTKLPREYKIEVVRQYLDIIKSYENALDALSA